MLGRLLSIILVPVAVLCNLLNVPIRDIQGHLASSAVPRTCSSPYARDYFEEPLLAIDTTITLHHKPSI